MITKRDLLRTYDQLFPQDYTQGISDNLDALLVAVNEFFQDYTGPIKVNSGFRPPDVNRNIAGASPNSLHCQGLAVDLSDADGKIKDYILANLDKAVKLNLYFEDWRWTPVWSHIQLTGPKSRKRIYRPSMALAPAPNRWDGKYESKYDK